MGVWRVIEGRDTESHCWAGRRTDHLNPHHHFARGSPYQNRDVASYCEQGGSSGEIEGRIRRLR